MAMLLVTAGAAPLVAAAAETTTTEQGPDIAPGERLAGVVGVEGSELRSDMERRVFGHRMAAADSNASKAEIIATEVTALQQRLEELRDRKAALKAALANGSITHGEYAARMAELVADERALTRMLNVTAEAAHGLPEDVLRANGVNVSAIQELRENAANLTGPAVADIARQIAGPPADRGNASDRGNDSGQAPVSAAIAQAQSAVEVAETQVANAADRAANETETLEAAREKLETAKEKLDAARDAADAGNAAQARSLAEQAMELAREAAALAREVAPAGSDSETATTTTTGTETTTAG